GRIFWPCRRPNRIARRLARRSSKRNEPSGGDAVHPPRSSLFQSRPNLRRHRDGRAVEIGDQPPDRIVFLKEVLTPAYEQIDILVGNRQAGWNRLQTLTFLWVGNVCQGYMYQCAAHIAAVMAFDDPPLGTSRFAHAVDQIAQLALGQD